MIEKQIVNKHMKEYLMQDYIKSEIFMEHEMMEDIPAKFFIPEHQLLTPEEKKIFLESFKENELAKIQVQHGELAGRAAQPHHFAPAARDLPQQREEDDERAGDVDEHLHDVGPDDGRRSAAHGVDDHREAQHQHRPVHRHAGHVLAVEGQDHVALADARCRGRPGGSLDDDTAIGLRQQPLLDHRAPGAPERLDQPPRRRNGGSEERHVDLPLGMVLRHHAKGAFRMQEVVLHVHHHEGGTGDVGTGLDEAHARAPRWVWVE